MKKPDFKEEKLVWKKGYSYVIGVDEVGRGAFAGPVTVGAVVLTKESLKINIWEGVHDSKLLKSKKREVLSKIIKKHSHNFSISHISVSVINKHGIGKATSMAFRKAIQSIIKKSNTKHFVLVDGFNIKHIRRIGLKNQKAIIKGDRKSISIAAASIIAKVERDRIMTSLHKKYPEYNLSQHKGYGTKAHQEAIKKHGLSKIHRTSFNLLKFTK